MEKISTYLTVPVKNLDGIELGLLGDSVCLGSDGTSNVSAVAVTVSVGAITSIVGKEGSTALELRVGGRDTSVDHVGARVGTSRAVIAVGCATTVDMRDTGKTPSRGGLGDVGLLLKVLNNALNAAKVGLDDGVLLDVVNLYFINV